MKCTIYMAVSINGMITHEQTDSDWVSEADADLFEKSCMDAGCALIGRQTYDQHEGAIYPLPDIPNVVLTSEQREDRDNVYFVQDFDSAMAKITELGCERFAAVGGAQITKQCVEAGLVDHISVSVHPYIFGEGRPFFDDFKGRCDLKFKGVKFQDNEIIVLDYEILPKQ